MAWSMSGSGQEGGCFSQSTSMTGMLFYLVRVQHLRQSRTYLRYS